MTGKPTPERITVEVPPARPPDPLSPAFRQELHALLDAALDGGPHIAAGLAALLKTAADGAEVDWAALGRLEGLLAGMKDAWLALR